MSIKFICSCGKHLRAGEGMAARRAMCPRCGAPVGVPLLRPTHAGTLAAPLTPQERRRLRLKKSTDAIATEPAFTPASDLPPIAPFDPPFVLVPKWTVGAPPRQLETCWYECLVYPLLNQRLLWMLTLALTALSGAIVLRMPELPHLATLPASDWLSYTWFLLLPLLLLVFTPPAVECALKSALAGKGPGTYWPSGFLAILKSSLRWLICFFAGPIIPLTLAGYFWLYGGDLSKLDCAIMAELLVVAAAYWLLAVVCSVEGGRLRDANPVRVVQMLHRLRYRAIVSALIAPALACALGAVGFFALSALHQHTSAWLLLAVCWASGLFSLTALFRMLGVWCYRNPASAAHQGP